MIGIDDMTLEAVAILGEFLGSLAVVAAVIFGYVQIRHFRIQRRDLAAIELVHSFQDERFAHGYKLLHVLPVGLSGEEFKALGDEYVDAALSIGMKYETVGLLVFRGIVPLEIVEELVGGAGLILWQRMKPWVYAMREESGHSELLEWFEWLTIQFEGRRSDSNVPAYQRHRDWTPRR